MASAARKRAPEPEPVRPIIVKKIIVEGHGGHHGGAWKVAYADFVTAMMAFFLLLWILGATTEKQRKGIADYFSPTLVETRQKSGGGNGPLGGDSLTAKDKYPKSGGTGTKSITIPRDATGGKMEGAMAAKQRDRARFAALRRQIVEKMQKDARLRRLVKSVRFVETREGLRIDLVDQSDFAMFALGTDRLLPDAQALVRTVAGVISASPNDVIVRGHTDALPYAAGRAVNNWTLSSARAEATRRALDVAGVAPRRFARIEGVSDREPYVPADRYDPRNRRMSVTLAWEKGGADVPAVEPAGVTEEKASAH
ncbi:flagellar motor protein MotB [Sphingomonas jatrophae]|uniref:Chemotaxis protein MotB n=1 Tax=Sphingomonas jatrophae TaxID=1166337 RepID=A0A1I6MAI8_9SPHN|nr:flagellar motor protein MotB [Sphingomonas jatrophae]SFS12736.1 chemotaxis protein MotB [Sphingomonas jatrophae]